MIMKNPINKPKMSISQPRDKKQQRENPLITGKNHVAEGKFPEIPIFRHFCDKDVPGCWVQSQSDSTKSKESTGEQGRVSR
ncbi:MAG: hypothetical protein ABSE75_12755, partial [Acidimicrobiales bacterium]